MAQSSKRIIRQLSERGWLTAGQVGRLIQMSQTMVRRRVSIGDIPSTQVGGIFRIDAQNVLRVIIQYRHKNQYVIDLAIDAAREYIKTHTEDGEPDGA